MRKKSWVSMFLALVLILSVMAVPAAAEEVELSGKLTIWSWGADAEKAAREEMVEVFAANHPELEIEHVVLPTADSVWDQKSMAAFAAGTAGDVMQMSPDYYGLMTEYYMDLLPFAERDNVPFDTEFTDGIMDGYYRPDGKLEAMPLLANDFVFLYNKDMFDEFGVEYPTDDWTWTDVAEMAPKFVSGEGVDHTYAMVYHWVTPNFALISQGGVPYTDDFKTALVDSPEVAAGLNMFGQFVKEGSMPNDVSSRNLPKEQLFVSGKAAIFPAGGFEIATIVEEIGDNFEWGAVLPPKDPSGKNTNVTYATGYAINKDAQNPEAAWQFLKEVSYLNDDMARVTAKVGMPANKKVAENEFANTQYGALSNALYVTGMATSRLNIWGGALSPAGDQWTQMWEAVTVNGVSAEEAQEAYFPLIQQAFEELNIQQ